MLSGNANQTWESASSSTKRQKLDARPTIVRSQRSGHNSAPSSIAVPASQCALRDRHVQLVQRRGEEGLKDRSCKTSQRSWLIPHMHQRFAFGPLNPARIAVIQPVTGLFFLDFHTNRLKF